MPTRRPPQIIKYEGAYYRCAEYTHDLSYLKSILLEHIQNSVDNLRAAETSRAFEDALVGINNFADLGLNMLQRDIEIVPTETVQEEVPPDHIRVDGALYQRKSGLDS